jgi:5'-nucleotidase
VGDGGCAWRDPGDGSVQAARYAGLPVVPNAGVAAIAEQARAAAAEVKNEKLGVVLTAPFTLEGNPESTLGNLVTAALLDAFDADVAIHNVTGGLRAVLPAGDLTFGAVYEMFPFDNRVVILELDGAELREVLRVQAGKQRGRAGIAGIRATVTCGTDGAEVAMVRDTGEPVQDRERLRVVVNDFLATGGDGILSPVLPAEGFLQDSTLPRTRDALADWFRRHDRLDPADWSSAGAPRWQLGPGCAEAAAD